MTIYKLTDKKIQSYKNKYGENVCGANVLNLLGFKKNTIDKLLEYKGIDFEWDDMLAVIKEDDSKIKNKQWIKDKTKTTKSILSYNKKDYRMNEMYIKFITDELKKGTYKIIGIGSGDIWGHYMIIGKDSKGNILTFDPPTQRLVIGIDNIISDYDEDDVTYIINYYNGLIIDRNKTQSSGTMRKKNKKPKKTKRKKKHT